MEYWEILKFMESFSEDSELIGNEIKDKKFTGEGLSIF
jgi:hypothetical protein